MKKSPLNKLVLETLGKPFYLNVVKMKNGKHWFPFWGNKFHGSYRRSDAVKLRRRLLAHLQEVGSPDWSEKDLKTVKVEYYKFI